jgi:hypothetical protein
MHCQDLNTGDFKLGFLPQGKLDDKKKQATPVPRIKAAYSTKAKNCGYILTEKQNEIGNVLHSRGLEPWLSGQVRVL